jgi:hypothetical protein
MKLSLRILSEQNLWLKLIILVIAFTLGFDASIKQLILLILLFMVYYLLQPSIYNKLLLAMRKVLIFITGYWIIASVFATPFPAMLLFSLQIIYFLVISLYALGTVDTRHFLMDTHRLQKYPLVGKITYTLMASVLFIRSYFALLHERQIKGADSLGGVFGAFAELMHQNYLKAHEIEEQVEASIGEEVIERSFFSLENFMAMVFLTALVLLGAI